MHPRIIDEDFKEVKIMPYVKGEMHINAGDMIAQLLLLRAKPLQQKEQEGLEELENVFSGNWWLMVKGKN